MSELSSLTSMPSAPTGIVSGINAAPQAANDATGTDAATGGIGGFQAMLAQQTPAPLPQTTANVPAANDAAPTNAMANLLATGAQLAASAMAIALTGNGKLPSTGKILPTGTAADATPTASSPDTTTPDAATSDAAASPLMLDPALAMMASGLAPQTPASVAPDTSTATPATAPMLPTAPTASPSPAPLPQPAPQAAIAQLAIVASPALVQSVGATPITVTPKTTATKPAANDSGAVQLRPVVTGDTALATAAATGRQDGQAGGQGASQNGTGEHPTKSIAPLATAAADNTTASAAMATTALSTGAQGLIGTAAMTSPQATPTAAPTTTDMTALVDRLVEARQAARAGGSSQLVQAAITHVEFGRVALNFNQDEGGLSVSLSSADPGFAPAAQAAMAQTQSTQIAASAGADSASTSTGGQSGNGQAGNNAQSDARTAGFAQNSAGGSTGGQSSGNGAQGQPDRWADSRDPGIASNPAPVTGDTNAALSRRSGILA